MPDYLNTRGLKDTFDSGPVLLNNTTFTRVGTINVHEDSLQSIRLVVAGQTLTALRLTQTPVRGGDHQVVRTHFGHPCPEIGLLSIVMNAAEGIDPSVAPAGALVDLRLNCDGVAEWGVEAKSDGGTLQMMGEG